MKLQETHYFVGQMDRTMLQSFCAAANLKALLTRDSDILTVKQCAIQVDKISQLFSTDESFLEDTAMEICNNGDKEQKAELLHTNIQVALLEKENLWKSRISGWTTPTYATRQCKTIIGRAYFSSYTESHLQGSIFFRPDDCNVLIPERIQDIFTVETFANGARQKDTLCVIKRQNRESQYPCMYSSAIFTFLLTYLVVQATKQCFKLLYTFEGLSEGVNVLAISPDGVNLLSRCKLNDSFIAF